MQEIVERFRWPGILLAVVLLSLAGCSEQPAVLDGVLPASRSDAPAPLTASGFIEAQEVSIVTEVSGRVLEVLADEADSVSAGQVLVVLDDSLLQADRAQAAAAVAVAEANLADLLAGATDEEIAAAQAAIDRANAGLQGARRAAGQAWSAASNPLDIDAQIASARIEAEGAQFQVEQARLNLERAQYELDLIDESRDRTRIEFQRDRVQLLVAQLAAAEANYNGILRKIELLEAQRAQPLPLIAEARQAQSQIPVAEAQLSLAQAQYDLVVAEPLPQEIAIARARIALAEAQVRLIDAMIGRLSLTSPIDGVVTTRAISAGETAQPGAALLTVADLETLKLVVYVPETQIGRVRLGAPVRITADAYPDRPFTGEVITIGRQAEFTPRNVQTEEERVNLVFSVEIRIDNRDRQLKPGMPADVVIETDD